MAVAKAIALVDPVEDFFGQRIETVYLRPPTAALGVQLGEPRLACVSKDASYWVEQSDVIAAYIDRLLSLDGVKPVDGGGGAILPRMGLADLIQIKDALFGFFTDARAILSAKRPIF
jgi:hypothetical protein